MIILRGYTYIPLQLFVHIIDPKKYLQEIIYQK